MAEWHPIETAPKDGTEVLIGGRNRRGNWFNLVAEWHGGESQWLMFDPALDYYAVECINPTHWFPLPAAPA